MLVTNNYLDILEVDFYHADFIRFFSKFHSANICKLSQHGDNVEFVIHNLADSIFGSHQESNTRVSVLKLYGEKYSLISKLQLLTKSRFTHACSSLNGLGVL